MSVSVRAAPQSPGGNVVNADAAASTMGVHDLKGGAVQF
jgi:hypothetical protein